MTRLQILIAENQYFIAMEVERLLTEAMACDIQIVALNDLPTALQRQRFDIVLAEAEAQTAVNIDRATAIEASGATVIFLSSYTVSEPDPRHVGSRLQVQKPLIHDELLGLVRQVANR